MKDQLDEFDNKICSSDNLLNVDQEWRQYDDLNSEELSYLYEAKSEAAKFIGKCLWLEKGERPTKYIFKLKKETTL